MFYKDNYYWVDGMEEYYTRYIRHMKDSDVIRQHLSNTRTVIQAGGHVGLFPLHLSTFFERVYTFEPDEFNFECLEKNNENRQNVVASQAVLGAEVCSVGMKLSGKNTGGHYVKPDGSGYSMITIDSLELKDVDAIVLDVEGQELNALIGAAETISTTKPVLMLEDKSHTKKGGCTTEELHKYLKSISYVAVGKKAKDTVFVHEENRV